MVNYQQILLDFSSHFHHFFGRLSHIIDHDYGWCIDELLMAILDYIDYAPTIDDGIKALYQDVCLYKEYYGGSPEITAPAICWLASTMAWEFSSMGLYDAMGTLHYKIGRDWPDPTTVVLEANNQLNKE